MRTALLSLALTVLFLPLWAQKGKLLENLTWYEAEKALTRETIVVIPLGAAAKEHGPHLLLKNDLLLAEYLKNRILQTEDVVIAPTVNYHHYPSFVEYPGSTNLRLNTARDLIIDICRSLARYGPTRFYILNTGISTVRALAPAADSLALHGITMRFCDLKALGPVEDKIRQQEGGTHADEMETSMMLYMDGTAVDMKKAVNDYSPTRGRGLTRDSTNLNATYSKSGVWGDATLATFEKGKILTEAWVRLIQADLQQLRSQK